VELKRGTEEDIQTVETSVHNTTSVGSTEFG